MSDEPEKLRHELEATRRALAEAEARCARNEAERNEANARILADSNRKTEQTEQEWMLALDVVNDPIFLHDKEFRILRCNKAYQQFAGIPFNQIIGRQYYEVFPKTHAPLPGVREALEKAQPMEEEIIVGDSSFRARSFSVRDEQGVYLYSLHILEDITHRKQSAFALSHANRALATLGLVNRQLVYATTEDDLLQSICQAIVEQRGYQMASVGYAQEHANETVKIMAHASHSADYLEPMHLAWSEAGHGIGPIGVAIRSGKTQVCQDIASDPHYLPWHESALKHGYMSCIALPMLDADNVVFGVLIVFSDEIDTFIPAEISLLEEMAGDMAFGVRTLRMRQERDQALEQVQTQLLKLESNLEDTVKAISSIVEMRDPYTSGHQARVADLAAAIAGQMGLPDEQIHGIHLAGVVHDLGKIQAPAEILSKPSRLNEIEYEMIKNHSRAGYEILKNIDFSWPVAQAVLQHHERIDGSGYPQGLKGDEIIFEARILAVADVVEAMYSHRPYRPGLGLEAALSEIQKGRGVRYDPAVADACLTLFRERNYKISA